MNPPFHAHPLNTREKCKLTFDNLNSNFQDINVLKSDSQ